MNIKHRHHPKPLASGRTTIFKTTDKEGPVSSAYRQRFALEAEKQDLLKVKQTADAARDALASGIDLSTIGALWLIAGIIFGMFPKELSDLITPPPPPAVWIWNWSGE